MESFPKGRDFAAWLGLTPRQHATGGKAILGRMSKMGQRDIRRLRITGAMAVVRWAVIRGANDPGCERSGACRAFAAQTAHGCGGGAGQQDGEDDLGGRSVAASNRTVMLPTTSSIRSCVTGGGGNASATTTCAKFAPAKSGTTSLPARAKTTNDWASADVAPWI